MNNIRQLNIFQLYRKLPYIIFNDTYLIPQRPSLPQNLLNLKTLTSLKQIANRGQSPNRLQIKNIPHISKQQLSKYKLDLQNYLNNYLLLTKQPKKQMICLKRFLEENTRQITEMMNGKQKITKTDLLKIFKSFPLAARADYQRRAQEDYQIEMEIFNQFQILHKIPPLKSDTPEQYYNRMMENQQVKSFPKFSRIDKKKKEIYNSAYLIASQHIAKNLEKFLKNFNLSREQFEIILQIQNKKKKYTELINAIKDNNSLIKKNTIESQLVYEQLGQDILQAGKLFKAAQDLPPSIINRLEKFFQKAQKKQFILPPVVEWDYQKSPRKNSDVAKASAKLSKKTNINKSEQSAKQLIKQANHSIQPPKQTISKSVQPDTIHPLSKEDMETVLGSSTSQLPIKANTQPQKKLPKLETGSKIASEQQFQYDSADDQIARNTPRSVNDELYDLDNLDNLQGLQILRCYDKIKRKLSISSIKK